MSWTAAAIPAIRNDDANLRCLSHLRLYSKGRILSHKRGKRNTRPNTTLVQIEGVANKEDAQFYLGKRVAYVYRAKREINGSKVRVIWGCVQQLSCALVLM